MSPGPGAGPSTRMIERGKPAKHWHGRQGCTQPSKWGQHLLTSHIHARFSALARLVEATPGAGFHSLCWERLPVQARGPASPAPAPSLPRSRAKAPKTPTKGTRVRPSVATVLLVAGGSAVSSAAADGRLLPPAVNLCYAVQSPRLVAARQSSGLIWKSGSRFCSELRAFMMVMPCQTTRR